MGPCPPSPRPGGSVPPPPPSWPPPHPYDPRLALPASPQACCRVEGSPSTAGPRNPAARHGSGGPGLNWTGKVPAGLWEAGGGRGAILPPVPLPPEGPLRWPVGPEPTAGSVGAAAGEEGTWGPIPGFEPPSFKFQQ